MVKNRTCNQDVATAIAFLTLVGFAVPLLGKLVNVVSSGRFGATGYVYRGIMPDGQPSGGGQFFVLRNGVADFNDLSWGDRLQAMSVKEFREAPSNTARIIFELNPRDCVIMLSRAGDELSK